jgi:hypothetical protein
MGRSTWDFLQDFYLRVEAAENYARRVEKDLNEAQTTAYQYQATLARCEASLSFSWETLNEERLNHRECQEALILEKNRHKETGEFLDRVLKEAVPSSEITDSFSGCTPLKAYQAAPNLQISFPETSLAGTTLPRQGTFTSVGEDGRETATLVSKTGVSNDPKYDCAYDLSSTRNSTQVCGGTSQVIRGGNKSYKTKRGIGSETKLQPKE